VYVCPACTPSRRTKKRNLSDGLCATRPHGCTESAALAKGAVKHRQLPIGGLTSRWPMYTICSMGAETIGEALALGWRVVARCVRGREDGPSSKSSRSCIYRRELDLETLVCTRGRAFPLSRLESRLRCPRCGNRRMIVMFEPPPTRAAAG